MVLRSVVSISCSQLRFGCSSVFRLGLCDVRHTIPAHCRIPLGAAEAAQTPPLVLCSAHDCRDGRDHCPCSSSRRLVCLCSCQCLCRRRSVFWAKLTRSQGWMNGFCRHVAKLGRAERHVCAISALASASSDQSAQTTMLMTATTVTEHRLRPPPIGSAYSLGSAADHNQDCQPAGSLAAKYGNPNAKTITPRHCGHDSSTL